MLGRVLFGAGVAGAIATSFAAVEACLPDTCDDPHANTPSYQSSCDGNVLVTHRYESCKDDVSRGDCAAAGKVCSAGTFGSGNPFGADCYQPCTADAECPPDRFCSSGHASADGRSTCQRRLGVGSVCTSDRGGCLPGLVCAPRPTWGGLDAGAVRYTSDSYCDEDCSSVDASAQTCPVAAASVCEGNVPTSCRCRVPADAGGACDGGESCVFGAAGGAAFCAVSADPDPRCGPGFDSYCIGSTFVACQDGFVIRREVCTPSTSCTKSIGCYAGDGR